MRHPPMTAMDELKTLRDRLDALDAELLAKAAERLRLVEAIAAVKQARGRELRDFRREREVLAKAEATASRLGLDPRLARSLLLSLIEHSLARQERIRMRQDGAGGGREALVIGGGGRMGRWFARFLHDLEWRVRVADPAGSPDDFPLVADWREAAASSALILLATPIQVTAERIMELAAIAPAAVILEIASVKTPLLSAIAEARRAGLRLASIHPLFGPGVTTLAGRHVVMIEGGSPEAAELARSLFAATAAKLVEMSLQEHDRLMAEVLVLSHALNIGFAAALAAASESHARLLSISSTTFERQLAVAREVVAENPALYFEIQRLDPHAAQARRAFRQQLERLERAVEDADGDAFAALMEEGRRWFDRREEAGA